MNTAAPAVKLEFASVEAATLKAAESLIVVGRPESLAAATGAFVDAALLEVMVGKGKVGDAGKVANSWAPPAVDGGKMRHLSIAMVPSKASRHNTPARPDAVTALLASALGAGSNGKGDLQVVVVLEKEEDRHALVCAAARAFPSVSLKSSKASSKKEEGEDEEGEDEEAARADGEKPPRSVTVSFVDASGASLDPKSEQSGGAAGAVRRAAELVDLPAEQVNVNRMVEEALESAERLRAMGKDVTATVIRGDELRDQGYGGIYGVGKAAKEPPALVVLSYEPSTEGVEASETVAWVGKGIVYDTGGLSLKVGGGMVGMKSDMGGSAAMLSAYEAAVALGTTQRLHLLLCLAENAIGPGAFRNDDVLKLFSGKTVEINNTDAEGRLVLGDGVAHASKVLSPTPTLIVDMATLTGAQLVTTGKKHAAVMSNQEDVEQRAVAAGKASGDLTFPILYCPEFYRAEFASKVADMKNSVKDRMNAQTSCAGTFVGEHLDSEYEGGWLHIDMAGPATSAERGTGYGVGLLLSLAGVV